MTLEDTGNSTGFIHGHAAEHAGVEHRHVEDHSRLSREHLAAHEALCNRHVEEHSGLWQIVTWPTTRRRLVPPGRRRPG